MDTSKLYHVTLTIKQEIDEFQLPTLLANLVSHLQQSITQPNEQTSTQFKNTLEEFRKSTGACRSNDFTIAEKKILQEISGDDLTGIGLYKAVEAILTENIITPGEALGGLQKMQSELKEFTKHITNIDSALIGFRIEPDKLSENECELTYILPEDCIGGSLISISEEMQRINSFLMTIQEILQQDLKSPAIRKLSTSNFQVFLTSTPAIIFFSVTILERLVALIKKIAETQKIYKDMKVQQLPASITEPLKKHIEQTISVEMSKLAEKLVKDNYKTKDDGRKNELVTKLHSDLKFLIERIDNGAVLEANMREPEEPIKPKTDEAGSDRRYETAQKEYQERMKMLEKLHNSRLLLEDVQKEGRKLLYITVEKSSKGDEERK